MAFSFVEETFHALAENALATNENFTYEGHFTNEATWDIPRRFKAAGYSINLIFFGLTDTNLSELRVVDRTNEGGHYVDPVTVADNYFGNLEKLNLHYAMFDSVIIVDTSETEHQLLTIIQEGLITGTVNYRSLPLWFQKHLPDIAAKIKMGK